MPDAPVIDAPVTPPVAPSWRDSIPTEYKDHASLKDIKDIPGLVKGYVSAQAMVGADKIVIPGKDAKPEQINEYWTKLGRPETADKYELPKDNMPEGVTLDETLTKAAFDEFHKLGISKNQAAELVRWQAKASLAQQEAAKVAQNQKIQENVGVLRKEFGQAFDEKDRQATNAVETYGGKEAVELLKKNPSLATDPVFVRMMAKIGREIAEDPIRGGGHQQSFAVSPGEAQARINAKLADETFMKAYTNRSAPNHNQAVEELNALYQAAKPEPQPT